MCEGVEWPRGTLPPLCEIPQSFPTRKQHVLGFGFSKSAVMHHILVWHQLEDNRFTPSVEGHAIGMHTISTQLPVGFIFQASGRHTNSLRAKPSALRWQVPFFKDPFHALHNGPHFCHGTSTCRARAKPHSEIQVIAS